MYHGLPVLNHHLLQDNHRLIYSAFQMPLVFIYLGYMDIHLRKGLVNHLRVNVMTLQ